MVATRRPFVPSWTTLAPVVAIVALVLTWGRHLGTLPVILVALALAAAVLAAVHHAEVVAHRVGEPFGSLVLAVAVTVIEVALIVTLMVSGGKDTAVTRPRHRLRRGDDHLQRHRRAVACSSAPLRYGLISFNAEGTGAALATVTDAGHAEPGAADLHHQRARARSSPRPARLRRGGLAGALRHVRARPRPVRHRDFFLPVTPPTGDGRSTRGARRAAHRPRDAAPASACCSSRWSPSSAWPRSSRPPSRPAWPRPASRSRSSASSSPCWCCCPRPSPPSAPPGATASRPASTSRSARRWPASA